MMIQHDSTIQAYRNSDISHTEYSRSISNQVGGKQVVEFNMLQPALKTTDLLIMCRLSRTNLVILMARILPIRSQEDVNPSEIP